MASIQRIGFTRYQNDLSKIFKALGHPARIAIIDLLIENDRISCKELAMEISSTPATTTHHLQILMESGLIGYEKIANLSYYLVNPLLIDEAHFALLNFSNKVDSQNNDYRNVVFSQHPFSESF